MKIKKSAIIFFLPVFFILGCDSGQDSPVSEKAETTQTAPVATEEAPAPITAQEPMAESTGNDEAKAEAESEPVEQAAISGEQVYQKACVTCHKTGVANAPKLGDADAWAPRIAKGKEALYSSSLNGVPGTAMVARGGCGTCSDEELHAAVDYMVSSAK
ncbi:MAG: c-type cytochrome [Gammaproteobacteria bacterium]|nr:c-type cytochrome [Gammaproteobacteria bacterium]